MTPLKPSQIGALESREFLGEETWKRWNVDMESMLAFRKTIKGKPTEEQKAQLEFNNWMLDFYGSVLFHSVSLARRNRCVCNRCAQARQRPTPAFQ